MVFASAQQTSITIYNSFHPIQFIVLLYFVSDGIICAWGMFAM